MKSHLIVFLQPLSLILTFSKPLSTASIAYCYTILSKRRGRGGGVQIWYTNNKYYQSLCACNCRATYFHKKFNVWYLEFSPKHSNIYKFPQYLRKKSRERLKIITLFLYYITFENFFKKLILLDWQSIYWKYLYLWQFSFRKNCSTENCFNSVYE